jgi:hypothetical protein
VPCRWVRLPVRVHGQQGAHRRLRVERELDPLVLHIVPLAWHAFTVTDSEDQREVHPGEETIVQIVFRLGLWARRFTSLCAVADFGEEGIRLVLQAEGLCN